jgi:outer membrane protein
MKKSAQLTLGIFIALAILLTGTFGFAGEKTGFVDSREILLNTEAGKKAQEEFKKVFDKNLALKTEKETELNKLKDEIKNQLSVLTEAAKKEKEVLYNKKMRDYELFVNDINEEMRNKQQELLKDISEEMGKLIRAIGEKEKYTLIIDIGTIPVAYFDKGNDLTKRVIDEFNKTYKAKK